MALIHRLVRLLSDLGMAVSVLVLVGMTGLVLAEVVLRNLFGRSTFVMAELVGYGVAAMTMMALGHSLEKGTLIRMNLLLTALRPDSLLRRLLEIVAVLLALVACAIAVRYFFRNALRSYERGFVSETAAQVPLWIPEAFVVAGLSILILQLLSYLLRLLTGAPVIESQDAESSIPTDPSAAPPGDPRP